MEAARSAGPGAARGDRSASWVGSTKRCSDGGAAASCRAQTVEALTTRHTVGLLDRTLRRERSTVGSVWSIDSKHHGPGADWFGRHCSPRTFGHGGYVSSLGFADPEHGLVVALVFNGMTDQERHDARMRATLDALYEDLGIVDAANETTPRVFQGLDASLHNERNPA